MIRAVKHEDLAACADLIRRSFQTVADEFGFTRENAPRFTAFATTEERLIWHMDSEHRLMYLDEEDGRICGYYSLLLREQGECELGNLAVLPEYRHRGIGAGLLQHAVKTAGSHHCTVIKLSIVEENKVLRKWYESCGAVHTGTEKFDFFPFTCGYMKIPLQDTGKTGPGIMDGADRAESGTAENEAAVNDSTTVKKQYKTADQLKTRISIHSRYSTNKQGFGNWITSHYQIRDGMSVLELGCGTGGMWAGREDIIRRCSRFVLSDFSEGMLNKAKETLRNQPGIEYRVIDIQDIPFADYVFDVVIANMMLYHVPDLQKGLREVKRVLKQDGTFYCATYGENGMMAYIYSLFADRQMQYHVNDNFTLQNGEKKLGSVFSEVRRFLYEDSLEVTDAEDMVDYIYSLSGMTDLQKMPRSEVKSVLEKNMRDGVLHIPKEYGMFIAGLQDH